MLISSLIRQGKQDAWLMPWWAGTFGMAVSLVWVLLYRYYPGQSLAQIPVSVLGRPLGMAVSLLFFVYFCLVGGWVLRDLSDFLNGTIMPRTPPTVFHAMFLFVVGYTVAQGVETIARLNQFITSFLFFPFWSVLILALSEWDWERIQPILRTDIGETMIRNHYFLGFPYLETLVMMMFLPHLENKAGRSFVIGIGTASLSLSVILFMITGLLGVERASNLTYPIYTVVQEIMYGGKTINIHSVISVVLLILIFIKLLVLVYGAYECLNQLFQPAVKWPFFIVLGMILCALALTIYDNPIQDLEWGLQYNFIFYSMFAIVLPVMLLMVTWIKAAIQKKKGMTRK